MTHAWDEEQSIECVRRGNTSYCIGCAREVIDRSLWSDKLISKAMIAYHLGAAVSQFGEIWIVRIDVAK